jgi:hypothetical protein
VKDDAEVVGDRVERVRSEIQSDATDADRLHPLAVLGLAEAGEPVNLVAPRKLAGHGKAHLARAAGDEDLLVLEHGRLDWKAAGQPTERQ